MSTYKLTYFPLRARAELARFVFAQAGVKYEDVRIANEKWKELKPCTPLGHLPTLEVDGKTLCGSTGIARFLAERFGLAGSNDIENAEIWGTVDEINDLFESIVRCFWEKDETRKAQMEKDVGEKTIPNTLGCFEKIAITNDTPEGWLYGKVTYADLYLYIVISDFILKKEPALLDKFPTLKKLHASVEALPNIAKWLKERPESPF